MRFGRLAFVLALLFEGSVGIPPRSVEAAPHIVVIQVDDLSVNEFEDCLALQPDGSRLCPNWQSLKDRGVYFPNAIVTNSVCGPSRGTFLTGQYSSKHVHCNEPTCSGGTLGGVTALDHTNTLATWLRDSTPYRRAFLGKYVNLYGDQPSAPIASPRNPLYIAPGWTTWQALVGTSTYKSYGFTLNDNGVLVPHNADDDSLHQTAVLSQRATAWIAANKAAAPLFVYLTPVAVHTTSDFALAPDNGTSADSWKHVNAPDRRKFGTPEADTIIAMPFRPAASPAFNEADMSDKPLTMRPPLMTTTDKGRAATQFRYRMGGLLGIDDMLGQVEAAFGGDPLCIVVTSDNGWNNGKHRKPEKMVAYDPSIFVPLTITCTGVPGFVPGVRTEPVLNQDITATVVEWAGATPGKVMDGRSLVPLLQGQTVPWRTRAKIEHWSQPSPSQYIALRTFDADALPNRLYVEWPTTGECELYNGGLDPEQLQNVCGSQPSEKTALKFLLDALRVCSGSACAAAEGP